MKKVYVVLVAVVLALCCVFASACIPSDYTKAESNLKDKDYSVTVYSKDGLISGTVFAAVESAFDLKGEINSIVVANKRADDKTYSGAIYYFSDKEDAKAWADYNKEQLDANKKKAKSNYDNGDITESQYKEMKEQYSNTIIRISDANVYVGDKKTYSAL